TYGFADLVGVLGSFGERVEHFVAELVQFGLGGAELEGHLVVLNGVEALADLKSEGEIRRGYDVGAAAGGGEFADFDVDDGLVDGFAGEAGASKQGEVRSGAADRAGPAGFCQYFAGGLTFEGAVQALTVGPPCAQC